MKAIEIEILFKSGACRKAALTLQDDDADEVVSVNLIPIDDMLGRPSRPEDVHYVPNIGMVVASEIALFKYIVKSVDPKRSPTSPTRAQGEG